MKLTNKYQLRMMAGEYVLMPRDAFILEAGSPLIVNETMAFVINEIMDDKSEEQILKDIISEYDIDNETASIELTRMLDILQMDEVIA